MPRFLVLAPKRPEPKRPASLAEDVQKRVRKWAGEVPIKALLYSCPDKAGLEDRE